MPLRILQNRTLLRKKILCLLSTFFLAMLSVATVSSESSTLIITAPQLRPGQVSPIVGRETALVWVNVTSSYSVLNVTLHYISAKGEGSPLVPTDRYDVMVMNIVSGNRFNATYEAVMPTVENNTAVWGFAIAFDDHGNIAQSENQRIYYAMTPNPSSSYLDLTFYVRHVNPKTMQMNLTFYAVLSNAYSYAPEALRLGYYGLIFLTKPEGKYVYSNPVRSIEVFYTRGHPELYPFDGYNYTLKIEVPQYLNQSLIRFNGVQVNPNTVYVDYVLVTPGTIAERVDNSAWKIRSRAQYFPSANFTAYAPYLTITILLERQPEPVDYTLLAPTISLCALLGFSVLIRGRNELRNRLLVYLNVFVFSYGFESSIRTLWITPITLGFTMIDRLVLALVPLAAIFAIFSIAGAVSTQWKDGGQDLSKFSWALVLDICAVSLSALVLSVFTTFTVEEYIERPPWFVRVTSSLFDMGWYGKLVFAMLFMGVIFNCAIVVVAYRARRRWLKQIGGVEVCGD
jgi:hypothetical protein